MVEIIEMIIIRGQEMILIEGAYVPFMFRRRTTIGYYRGQVCPS